MRFSNLSKQPEAINTAERDVVQKVELYDVCLDNIKEKILVLLLQHEKLEPVQLSKLLGIGTQFSLFHLKDLKKSNMVIDYHSDGSSPYWGITQYGQAYLFHHGMLS